MKFLTYCLIAQLLLASLVIADFVKFKQAFDTNSSIINTNCINDLIMLQRENPSILKTWSTFTSTHNYGNSHDFGDFFGCNSLNNTQYCLVQYFQESNLPIPVLPSTSYYQKLWTDLDVSFLGAVCLPSSCDSKDVREILENFYEGQNLTFSDKIFCKSRKSEKFGIKLDKNNFSILNWWNWQRIGIFSLLFVMAAAFSMSGVNKLETRSIVNDLFNNGYSNDSTGYMNGIKAISMIFIVMGHSYVSYLVMPFKSGENLQKLNSDLSYQPLGTTFMMMELFFVIGGMLTARSIKKGMDGPNKLYWILKFYIKRFMRLVPVTIFYILLLTSSDSDTMAPYNVGMTEETRKQIWFMPLIYNFLSVKITYSSMIWFVSVYLQLSIMAPFVLLLTRMKKYGNKISIVILIVFGLSRYIHLSSFINNLIASTNAETYTDDFMNSKYVQVVFRLFPFFGGVILENDFSEKPTLSMTTLKYSICAVSAVTLLIAILGKHLSILPLIVLADTHLIAIILLALYLLHHNDWIIKKFLSHKFWEPISKMGLSIYLITSYYLFTIHEREVEPIEVRNELHFFWMFLMDILKTSVPILLTFVFVEEPWSRFGDYWANRLFMEPKN